VQRLIGLRVQYLFLLSIRGVGTDRKSVALKTKTGQYFITPDNGTLTLVAENLGIEAVREIDEATNRLEGSEESYTFYGRDIFALAGARLASGMITFEEVGRLMEPPGRDDKLPKGRNQR